MSDFSGHCIVVYETSGRFVTSFGRFGWKEGQFRYPCCITCCVDVLYMFVTVSMVGYRFFEHFTNCPDDGIEGIDQTFTIFSQS